MNREVLDRWCERGILGLVLAILVVGRWRWERCGPRNFSLFKV
jgi:hypothetical protein